MPNYKTHQFGGAIGGGAFAYYCARGQEPQAVLLETMSGALTGSIIGVVPDRIDPPNSPRHRSAGHGVVPVAIGTTAYLKNLDSWQNSLRSIAQEHTISRSQTDSFWSQLWHLLVEILCRIAAGALAGIAGGYISHLALDATTPMGLPILA